jgi:hypothetical protein
MQQDENVDWSPEAVGSFGGEQITWLRNEMNDGKPAFFFHHHALATEMTTNVGYSGMFQLPFEIPRAEANLQKYELWKKIYGSFGIVIEKLLNFGDFDYTDPIYSVLKDYNDQMRAVFFGHSHVFLEDECEGIPIFMTDS